MPIRPIRLPSDRFALLEFLQTRDQGLSENKHAYLAGTDDLPGAGILSRSDGDINGYVGLVPAQEGGEWAMELIADPQPTPALVDAAVQEAALRGGRRLRWWVYHQSLEGLAGEHGFEPERELLMMARSLPASEMPVWSGHIGVSPFRPGVDEESWLAVNNAAFAGHPENGGMTRRDLQRRMEMDWFDPEGLRMAWSGDRLAGFCWTKIHWSGEGEVYIIAVSPDFQGIGLGRALVLEGMRHLTERGCDRVFLYTEGDNAPALGLYRALGFMVERTHHSFIRELTP